MCDRILHLKQIYGELYGICDQLNMAYGKSLLALLTERFAHITSNCYWGYMGFNDNEQTVISISILIPEVTILIALCSYCTTCFQQVKIDYTIR